MCIPNKLWEQSVAALLYASREPTYCVTWQDLADASTACPQSKGMGFERLSAISQCGASEHCQCGRQLSAPLSAKACQQTRPPQAQKQPECMAPRDGGTAARATKTAGVPCKSASNSATADWSLQRARKLGNWATVQQRCRWHACKL